MICIVCRSPFPPSEKWKRKSCYKDDCHTNSSELLKSHSVHFKSQFCNSKRTSYTEVHVLWNRNAADLTANFFFNVKGPKERALKKNGDLAVGRTIQLQSLLSHLGARIPGIQHSDRGIFRSCSLFTLQEQTPDYSKRKTTEVGSSNSVTFASSRTSADPQSHAAQPAQQFWANTIACCPAPKPATSSVSRYYAKL